MLPHEGLPEIIGFDLPAEMGDLGGAHMVIVSALLTVIPDAEWMQIFEAEAAKVIAPRFRVQEIRLVGHHLNLLGDTSDAPALAGMIRLLVGLASQRTLNHRLTRRGLAGGMVPPLEERHASAVGADRLKDIRCIQAIPAVPYLLQLTSRLTGLRFVTVASVTAQRWTACEVYDVHGFGVQAGQDLALETTISNEIRLHGATVQFDDAASDARYCTHPTPAMYGFQSYLATPVRRRDGTFFGTLCALDARPSQLSPQTVRCVEVFARLIGIQLELDATVPSAVAVPDWDVALSSVAQEIEAVLAQTDDAAVRAVAAGMLQVMREQARRGDAAGLQFPL